MGRILHQWIPALNLFVFVSDPLNICLEFLHICAIRTSERAVWENLADFSSPPRERKEGSVISGSVARFFPNGKSNLWLGNKLDFLRIEITQQACISRLIGRLQISFVISGEDCYCCWKGYKEEGASTLLQGFTMVYTP